MRIDRENVIRALEEGGRSADAARARQVLGSSVDTVADAELLRDLGIEPGERAQGGVPALRRPQGEEDRA